MCGLRLSDPPANWLCRGEVVEGAALDSTGDYLWLRLAGRRHTRVFHTRTWRSTGDLEGGQAVLPVYGSIEPWVALLEEKTVTLHPPHGGRRHLNRHRFGYVGALAVSNQGASISALSHRNVTPEGQIESGALDDGGGPVGHHVWIPSVDQVRVIATANTTRQALHQVATSRTTETTYVSAVAMGGVRMLVGYAATPEGLEHRWDVHVPSSSVLVHHPEARGVALLVRHSRGARWFPLDTQAPALPADVYEAVPWAGDLDESASALEGGLLGLARPQEPTEAGPAAPGILRAIQRADAAEGPSAAVEALDCLEVHQRVEIQSRGRLAAAWLELNERDDRDRYRKLVALAGFLDAHRQLDSGRAVVLSLDQAAWDRHRLDEVAARAEAWLAG